MPPFFTATAADLSPLQAAVSAFLAAGKLRVRLNGEVIHACPEYEVVKGLAWGLFDFPAPLWSDPMVRIKPTPNLGPWDTGYIHTDVWAGNSGLVVMIPIEGDFETGGVEFFAPTRNYEALLKPVIGSYEAAPDVGPKLIGRMEPGNVYVLSPMCLHRTMAGGGRRVSVDFRVAFDRNFAKQMNYRVRYENL